MGDRTLRDRLSDIEVRLSEHGFAAVVDPEERTITAVPKAAVGPDPSALWRLLVSIPATRLTESDLRSDDYLLIALGKVGVALT